MNSEYMRGSRSRTKTSKHWRTRVASFTCKKHEKNSYKNKAIQAKSIGNLIECQHHSHLLEITISKLVQLILNSNRIRRNYAGADIMQEWWLESSIKIDICPFRARWTGQTHSVPGGSSCQLGLLQQHHILHATFGQVIGHAGPHTPTPDDHSLRGVFPPLSQHRGCIAGRKEGRVTCEAEGAPPQHFYAHKSWLQRLKTNASPLFCTFSRRAAYCPHGSWNCAMTGCQISAQMSANQLQYPRHGWDSVKKVWSKA